MKAGHLGAVRNVVGRISGLIDAVCGLVRSAAHGGKCSENQVMYAGNAFGCDTDGCLGQQDVVVDQCGAVPTSTKTSWLIIAPMTPVALSGG